MSRVRLIGGPADGGEIPPGGTRRWVTAAGNRGYKAPGPDRYLYLKGTRGYIFAGHDARVCTACGAFAPAPTGPGKDSCGLCGGPAVSPHRRGARPDGKPEEAA